MSTIGCMIAGGLLALGSWFCFAYARRARMRLRRYLNGRCQYCGGPRQYDSGRDAYWCQACNRWLEPKCGDKTCDYCTHRPKTPGESR